MIDQDGVPASVFQSDLPLDEKLDRARTELLDLSARNRLLNMPRSSKGAKAIEVVDEVSAEIFRLLVGEGRPFTFLAGKAASSGEPADGEAPAEDADEIADLAQPEDDIADDRGVFSRHADTRLQTRLTPKGLQKRLLELYFDARTLEEEQGVNILYLALGALKWIDPNNAANVRFAPLVLVPAQLERGNAGEKFKLRMRQEDYASNLSLEVFLDRVHGIRLPAFEAGEGFDPVGYFGEVADAVSAKPGWEVQPDVIVLGFFSFAKFLMYRDLDPQTWPQGGRITDRGLVRGLLSDGFSGAEGMVPEDANIDPFIPPSDMLHIVDSDSSQALAVHEVRRGRDVVIQGPPGTGKSQTIANIIASAVADGKTVLFVAEKMAALEVVKRRLDATGVGDACLELHSNKANKKALLEELRRTWELGAPRHQDPGSLHARLTAARDRLNDHARRMHAPHGASGLTPFQVVGQLSRLRLDGEKPNDIVLALPETWSADDFAERHDVIRDLAERIDVIGRPAEHAWRGVGLSSILPTDVERLGDRVGSLLGRLSSFGEAQALLASTLETSPAQSLTDLPPLLTLAGRVAGAPDLDAAALASSSWGDRVDDLERLIVTGQRHAFLQSQLAGLVAEAGWATDLTEAIAALAPLPSSFSPDDFRDVGSLAGLLPRLQAEAEALARAMTRDTPTTLEGARRMYAVAERVAAAPEGDAEAFASEVWNAGVERASDLVEAVAAYEAATAQVAGRLTEAAWNLDLSAPRATLAAHGTGLFRFVSGDWRRANALVRSVLTDQKTPLAETLELLDALATGQSAKRTIEGEEAFARAAFGTEWRGPRSTAAPLRDVVEWMRSLRALGAEPRMIAARRPDRTEVDLRAKRLVDLAEQIRSPAERLWSALNTKQSVAFGDALSSDRADLLSLLAFMSGVRAADVATSEAFIDVAADFDARRRRLAGLEELQAKVAKLHDLQDLGSAGFGDAWGGIASDWSTLRSAADWIQANGDIRLLASRVTDRKATADAAEQLGARAASIEADLQALIDDLCLDVAAAFDAQTLPRVPLEVLTVHLDRWRNSGEQLFQWTAYRDRAGRAAALGCDEVVRRLGDGRLATDDAVSAFEMAYYEAVYADQIRVDPELGTFDGTLHGRLAREFADMDRQRIASASFEVVRAHHEKVPARDGGSVGPLGVLRAEIARKRGHMPIRKLMEKAAPAVQALKPVFMMSPLSVAQFLSPGVFDFDLLVMDEASQIQPVDALGAVARAKQVVVVGDPKQLPPTAFFSKMTGGAADDDEDAGTRVADIESILGLFTARGLPMRMLRWHYRSKHQSLIAVSNRQFYENKLFIVPSPYTAEAGMGLRFHRVPQGVFDAGGTRTNQVEAKIVAQAIVAHAREHPELSLGVAAFSAAQRRAILDQLEVLRRGLPPETESFFQSHPAEPFFVKNLENVQGDERDVIFISVGYGPPVPGGKGPMRFGPLGTDGGERRLNVLISRAKQRCEVFASMSDEDIDPDFASTRKGVLAFKLFLHFARTGRMTMAESTGRDHDSVFEEQVAKALQARGYQVHRQVGLAGFFIDLAVSDADRPGRYLLGIECDGASYHDARSARDRDRLRQSVLESHGWTIHRIWSTDWFQRPNEQIDLVVARIEAAKAEHDAEAQGAAARRRTHVEIVTVEREGYTEVGLAEADAAPATALYEEAMLERPRHLVCELHETPRGALSALAEEVVGIEGPVHICEVVNRIRDAWGLKRAGGRIQEAVEKAVEVSVREGRLVEDGDFLNVPGRTPRVRDRSEVRSTSLRKCDSLPPAELEAAILGVVRKNYGAIDDQVVHAAARAVGFKATSGQLRDLLAEVIAAAVAGERLTRRNGMLVIGPAAANDDVPARAQSPLSQLIATGESERLEFKETLRWDVAADAMNKKLEDVVVKTIAGFANGGGGTLLIGVANDGTVKGLDRDYACLGGNRDKLELHLTNLLGKHFGAAFRAARIGINFPQHEGRDVCRIEVGPAVEAQFVSLPDRGGSMAERFFVRSGNSTQELTPSQMHLYVGQRFRRRE
jgi:very-short-patch-repair endonuclease